MLVLHDDAAREYAYGPAAGLPDSKLGTFTQALYDEAKKNGWFYGANVRSGSQPDIAPVNCDVRFYPESGHWRRL